MNLAVLVRSKLLANVVLMNFVNFLSCAVDSLKWM